MFELGSTVDVRYYGQDQHVTSLTGVVIYVDTVGIVILSNSSVKQCFPWTSVQRVIVNV